MYSVFPSLPKCFETGSESVMTTAFQDEEIRAYGITPKQLNWEHTVNSHSEPPYFPLDSRI